MSCINIDEDIFKDFRFIQLYDALGSRELALGALVGAWFVAQKFWRQNEHGIPKPAWTKQRLRDELITAGFAEDRGDFIYMAGSAKQFAWIRKRVEAGRRGGLKSQENRSSKRKQTQANASKDGGREDAGQRKDEQIDGNVEMKEESLKQIQANASKRKPFSFSLGKENKNIGRTEFDLYAASGSKSAGQENRVTREQLEQAYVLYPRKQKKKAGIERLAKSVKTQEQFQSLLSAIRNYQNAETVKRGFVMNFSTFAGEWQEWTDPDHGKLVTKPKRELKTLGDLDPPDERSGGHDYPENPQSQEVTDEYPSLPF